MTPSTESPATAEAAASVIGMISASWMSRTIAVAMSLRVPDRLGHRPLEVAELAVAIDGDGDANIEVDSLRRLLRALCSLGLCSEDARGAFALTNRGRLLRSDSIPSLANFVDWWMGHLDAVWTDLSSSVRTGISARKRQWGQERFERLEIDPEAAAMFDRAMGEITQFVATDVAALLPAHGTVVDVGGGNGSLLLPILQARPSWRGVLSDLPSAVATADRRIASCGLSERCSAVVADFFDGVPAGGDVYLLKSILHDWNDERAIRILGNIRTVLPSHGRLLVIERVMPDRLVDSPASREIARNDLNMLVAVGGRERTQAAYLRLFEAVGFGIAGTHLLSLHYTALEAVPLRC